MSTYVLLHGAWHGAWCWNKVTPLIKSEGHSVCTPDLPGHGKNRPTSGVVTAADYVNSLRDLIVQQNQQVVLVGHSMGGMVISQVAELVPEHISTLVYLSGFLLENGQSINDFENQVDGSIVAPNLVLSRDKSSFSVPENIVRDAFYSDCNETDYQYALANIQPQPALPFLAPVNISEARYGSVPRVYIECLQDRAIPVSAQRLMYERTSCRNVFSLDSAHSPFFSVYNQLADILLAF